jgi:DNA-binding IclR family transcriptional regulator
LACLDGVALEVELARRREVRTVHTLTSRDALERELAQIRTEGVSIDDEENELGVRCVGAVVAGRGGRALAAISVSAPAARMPLQRCAEFAPALRAGGAGRRSARRRPPLDPGHCSRRTARHRPA